MKRLLIVICVSLCSTYIHAQNSNTYASSTFSLPVSDLEKSIEWYKQVLGILEYISPADGVVEFMINEKTWLQLFEGESPSNAILRLEVEDVKAHYDRIKKFGLDPTSIELIPNVVSFFDFKDPDGNQLSFYKLE